MIDIISEARQNSLEADDVFCIIVTYADRRELLQQVLNALPAQGVTCAVVVDNGATWRVKIELKAAYGDFVDVVEMGRNTGSAGGFAAGIQRAMDLKAEYLWLLDDDNRPKFGCLSTLLASYHDLRSDIPARQLAVLALRSEHQGDIVAGVPLRRIGPRSNSFRGFHICDIPYKIWRRMPWGRPCVKGHLPPAVYVPVAPYSGLLLSRDTVEAIGLPRQDFVLYADDTEYTCRITEAGGGIALIPSACLEDLESSWNVKARFGNSFSVVLRGKGDFRAYYGMRNSTYFDKTKLKKNGLVFWLNRIVFMSLLAIIAVALGHWSRYRLLREAIADGLSGQLGMKDRFPL